MTSGGDGMAMRYGASIQVNQHTVSDAILCHHSLGNQRGFIKGKGQMAGNEYTYYYSEGTHIETQ